MSEDPPPPYTDEPNEGDDKGDDLGDDKGDDGKEDDTEFANVRKSLETENKICKFLQNRQSVILSGPGGTGKSFLLKSICDKLISYGFKTVKTGSTGISAVNIEGMTINSWAGIDLGDKSVDFYCSKIKQYAKYFLRWVNTSILIIDEISMIGSSLFDKISQIGSIIRDDPRPFGGITLLLCGDICQLPPVKDDYFFKSSAYQKIDFQCCRLTHPWRFQNDLEFFQLLSRIRVGKPTEEDISKLRERVTVYNKEIRKGGGLNNPQNPIAIKPTRMFSKKIDVYEMNMKELDLLNEEEFEYVCYDCFDKKTPEGDTSPKKFEIYQSQMDKNIPSSVKLKKGAQVMLTYNLSPADGFCNGSRGVVIECFDDTVKVLFKNGAQINIQAKSWKIETENEVFTRYQMPLILAWSITIHKSQGSTLDCVIIDLGTSIFSDNMAYVALSRCRTIDSLYIVNIMPEKIKCNPKALEFENYLIENAKLNSSFSSQL